MPVDFDKLFNDELAAAERKAAADDELMAAALRGEPFWGAGKAPVPAEQIVGLADFTPLARPPIERYVRCSVELVGSKRRPVGSIEAGLEIRAEEDAQTLRAQLRAGLDTVCAITKAIEDADALTRELEEHVVRRWPGRAWFVEVWHEDEALTQVYAPHGMPRWR